MVLHPAHNALNEDTTMTSFRTLRNTFIISAAMLGMAATSLPAQAEPGRHGTAAEHEQMKAKWAERHAAHQAALHDKLALTPAQEAAWASYQAAIKPAREGKSGEPGARAEWKTMSAPARMAKRIAMTKERTAQMERRLAALNSLYAALTPAQQKLFDENSMQHGRRGHHGHGHGKHRMG